MNHKPIETERLIITRATYDLLVQDHLYLLHQDVQHLYGDKQRGQRAYDAPTYIQSRLYLGSRLPNVQPTENRGQIITESSILYHTNLCVSDSSTFMYYNTIIRLEEPDKWSGCARLHQRRDIVRDQR